TISLISFQFAGFLANLSPPKLCPFCSQNSHKLPLLATISCVHKLTPRVSYRKRIDLVSVTYKSAALTEISRPTDSQSSNPGSIPGSATNYIRQSPLIQRVLFLPKKLVALFARKKRSPWYTTMVHRDFDPKKA